ncbi:uncharacterized protein BXZ73DRAFT_98049 [Epithele typhae]|uniref:uncharacterized protein n=1 Tax=Epithele typhae TaxID=378194 RepID=UPI002007DE96|nr:uncharacterized protein BXZ73DRAFT_98049 [Epithele typhae]KAH9941662.1 hypothetical protein BXZ73DRAFT_98049 [Epithele typhae]
MQQVHRDRTVRFHPMITLSPSVYGAIKVRVTYSPGPNYTDNVCDVDFSSSVPFREYLASSTPVAGMDSAAAFRFLQSEWAVVGAITVTTYDYLLIFDREVRYVWRKKFTSAGAIYIAIRYSCLASNILTLLNFFYWPGKSTPTTLTPLSWQKCNGITVAFSVLGGIMLMAAAVFSSLRSYALCQHKRVAFLVLVLGSSNAFPSIYAAIKNKATYDPGPFGVNVICTVDFSQFLSFRNTTVLLTTRFILNLFEASDPATYATTVNSLSPSRAVAFRTAGGVSTTSPSQAVFAADVTWRGAEESESVCSNKDGYGYELQVNPGRRE